MKIPYLICVINKKQTGELVKEIKDYLPENYPIYEKNTNSMIYAETQPFFDEMKK